MNINIAFASDDNFCQHLCIAICSIMENSSIEDFYNIFVLDNDKISDKNKEKIITFSNNYKNLKIEFISIKGINIFENFPKAKFISSDMYSRLLLPNIFKNLDKILYLDCDIVVRSDIKFLYEKDIAEFYCAASCEGYTYKHYCKETLGLNFKDVFNSGVILFNLKKIREDKIVSQFPYYNDRIKSRDEKLRSGDQDILNIFFADNFLKISKAWNFELDIPYLLRYKRYYDNISKTEVKFLRNRKNVCIIHFIGPDKPWKYTCIHSFKRYYFYYLNKTPYSDFVVKKNLKLFFRKLFNYILLLLTILIPDSIYFRIKNGKLIAYFYDNFVYKGN